jgi:hypothetical protein
VHAVPHNLQPASPSNAAFTLTVKEHTKGLGLRNQLHGPKGLRIRTNPASLGWLLANMQ